MITEKQLERWQRGLESTLPIVGGMKRRSALKTLDAHQEEPEVIPLLCMAAELDDEDISSEAYELLRNLTAAPAVDALCEEAIKDPSSLAAKICKATGKRPSDHERACLFLFVTGQLDAYFEEDFEFQALRLEYDQADAKVQAHVMEVVRSGDRRCLGFFGRLKALSECTETEIKLAVESLHRHKDWARLFQACLELPMKYTFPLLDWFRGSGWEPDDAQLKSIYRQILNDSAGQSLPTPKKPKATSSAFERWLEKGRTGDLAQLAESDLLGRLEKATPPEGVSIVAALATKVKPGSETAKAVLSSSHWLVRLAGHACGLRENYLLKDGVEDDNYWIKELVSAGGALEFWPGKGTPVDLEKLSEAPAEAFVGKLGAVRKVLRTLMGYRITTGEFEEMVVEAGEFTGDFRSVTE